MRSIRSHSRVVPFMAALVVLVPIAPALGQAPQRAPAVSQGSRVPGMPVTSSDPARNRNRKPVEVTFTKWGIPGSTTPFSLLAGFTGGDVVGTYAGEVLQRVVTQAQADHNRVIWIEAMYEVQAGDRSFTTLIRGGSDTVTGAALLDGFVIAGWRTGAPVHVEFQTIAAPSPAESGCVGAPPGRTCFQGTIHVGPAPQD